MSMMKIAPNTDQALEPIKTDCWGANNSIETNRASLDLSEINKMMQEKGMSDLFDHHLETESSLETSTYSNTVGEPLWRESPIMIAQTPTADQNTANAPSASINPTSIDAAEYDRLISDKMLFRTGAVLESSPPHHFHSFSVGQKEYQITIQFGDKGASSRISGDPEALDALAKLRAAQKSTASEQNMPLW